MKTYLIIPTLLFLSCKQETVTIQIPQAKAKQQNSTQIVQDITEDHTITRSSFILADIDGDTKQDSVIIIKDLHSNKEGLRIVFANAKVDTLGIVRNVANQDFDDISWAGIFEKAPKGERYASNVDENGEFRDVDKVSENEWVTLKADGIYIHAAESCGGGMIYLENGEYKWIQQE